VGGGGYKERESEGEYGRSILCTCKWKMRPVETIPGMQKGIKENDRGGEFNYDKL
jgi:hypothetical protein